jgi:hypothetical protein
MVSSTLLALSDGAILRYRSAAYSVSVGRRF